MHRDRHWEANRHSFASLAMNSPKIIKLKLWFSCRKRYIMHKSRSECMFVLYVFSHRCTYFDQIWRDCRWPPWESFRHLKTPQIFRKLPQRMFLIIALEPSLCAIDRIEKKLYCSIWPAVIILKMFNFQFFKYERQFFNIRQQGINYIVMY
jgi:hypothetical protein